MEDSTINVFSEDIQEDTYDSNACLVVEDLSENDPLDHGVDVVKRESNNNPFYISIQQKNMSVVKTQYGKLRPIIDTHSVLVMIPKCYANIPTEIYEKNISIEVLAKICTSFFVKRCSTKILNVACHSDVAVIVSKEVLEHIDHAGIKLRPLEIVIPIFDMHPEHIDSYINIYGQISGDYEKLISVINMKNYFGSTQTIDFEFFENIIGDYFWRYDSSEFNMTHLFSSRKIRVNDAELLLQDTDTDIMTTNVDPTSTGNYATCSENRYRTSICDAMRTAKNRRFFLSRTMPMDANLGIDKETVTRLFMMLTDNQSMYNFFNAFAVSRKHSHLVVNNTEILAKMKYMFKTYKEAFRYVLSYPMLTYYVEECILRRNITKKSRCVFTIDTAHELPVFPFLASDVHSSPYNVIPVKDSLLRKNAHGLAFIQNHFGYGIDNLDGFRKKFNIFTTGHVDKNVFDGIDWSHIAVTGSTIPACVPTRSPLSHVTGVPSSATYEEEFNAYFNKYYGTSDIDVVCATTNLDIFFDTADSVIKQVKKNIGVADDKRIIVTPISMSRIFLNNASLSDYYQDLSQLCDEIKEPTDVRKVLKKCNCGTRARILTKYLPVIEYFYNIYVTRKTEKYMNIKPRNMIHQMYLEMCPIDHFSVQIVMTSQKSDHKATECIFVENKEIVNPETLEKTFIETIRVEDTFRFKVSNSSEHIPVGSAPILHRQFEIFRAIGDDPFSTIQGFHLPCVRGFYDGTNVYMTTSCVCSHLTYMNVDYKYFACAQQPLEIILKYMNRGYGLYLSEHEIASLQAMSQKSDILEQKTITNITGLVTNGIKPNITVIPYNNVIDFPTHSFYTIYDIDGNVTGFNSNICKDVWHKVNKLRTK
jgi:hypothetical protein